MTATRVLEPYFQCVQATSAWRWSGHVTKVVGDLVESEGPLCSIGESCEIIGAEGDFYLGQVVGFRGTTVLSMPLERPSGIRYGDQVVTQGWRPMLPVGENMLGRVIDGRGQPLDTGLAYDIEGHWPLEGSPPSPLSREPIRLPLSTGVRAIDGFITCGRGQRLGIFGGSGVGKSTLISMIARATSADLTVLGLIGERGREVQEFLEELGDEGRRRSVVVVSTSDQSPLLRIRAALAATAAAEYFSSRGKKVLLIMDSLTRVAMAQREIGLAAGEPPTAKGYTPSVYTLLAKLVERAGQFQNGSITAFYTVLMEGDDQQDPLVDAVRSLLDGHIVLDRRLAVQNHYPAISVLDSLSRLMSSIVPKEHRLGAGKIRELMAAYSRSADLIRVGAYQKGTDAVLDRAIAKKDVIAKFLMQVPAEKAMFEETTAGLHGIAAE